MVFRTGKQPSKTAQSNTSHLLSLRQRDLQLPSRSQSCLPASVLTEGRTGRACREKRFKQQAAAGLSDEGKVMGPPLLSPPAHPCCAWLLLLALGKENSARLRLPSGDGSVPAVATQSFP